ncbi:MAG: XisI protein [Cyanobacteria bacterium P01_E01_bin.42]
MDTLTLTLHEAIVRVLQEFREFLGDDPDAIVQLVLDSESQHYLLVETGWQRRRRIYGVLIHIDIIDGKIWIQHDGTETGIANELVDLGISKDKIVLAYKSLERRKITEFAVS